MKILVTGLRSRYGEHRRDFTYFDDIVEGVVRVIDTVAAPGPEWSGHAPDPGSSRAPYRSYNIRNNKLVVRFSNPLTFGSLEFGFESYRSSYLRKQVSSTYSGFLDASFRWHDGGSLERDVGYRPSTPIDVGIAKFVSGYKGYFKNHETR